MKANESTSIGKEVYDWLSSSGVLSKSKLARCTNRTRMLHDLGLYGDIAECMMEELEKAGVDLSGFDFYKYFPPEFPGESKFASICWTLVPVSLKIGILKKGYPPLYLKTIEQSLKHKVWSDT